MKTNHRHYILLIFAIAAIALSVFGYSFFRSTIRAQAIDASRILKEAASIDERKQREQDAASVYSKSVEERAKIGGYLVSQDKVVDLIEYIEKIGIDMDAPIELSSIVNDSDHFRARADAHGSWNNIMRVLVLLENMPYAASLNTIRVTQGGESVAAAELPVKGKAVVKEVPKVPEWRLTLDLQVLTTPKK